LENLEISGTFGNFWKFLIFNLFFERFKIFGKIRENIGNFEKFEHFCLVDIMAAMKD
jgi:hypothetical protein